MPITVLGLFQAASYTRYVRSAVLDVIRLDYVTTARSKGLNEGKVVASMDSLKSKGFNPNSVVLLPKWNDLAGH